MAFNVDRLLCLSAEEKERMIERMTKIQPRWWARFASWHDLEDLAVGAATSAQVQNRTFSRMQDIIWLMGHARLEMDTAKANAAVDALAERGKSGRPA